MTLLITLLFVIFIVLALAGIASNYLVKEPLYKIIIFWTTAFILILTAGFRTVGMDPDSVGYQTYYGSDLILLLAEPTFALISFIVKSIFNNFQFVLLIYAIIGISIKYKAIDKLTDLKFLSVIVYFGTYFLLHDFTQIRAAVASALLLLSIIPLSERRFWKFLLFVGVAFLFHYSSIVLLPLWFLTNKHIKTVGKITLYLIIPFGILLHFLNIDIMMAIPIETVKYKIDIYKSEQESATTALNVFNLVYDVKYLTFYVLLYFYETLYVKVKYMSILIKIYALSLFAYLSLSQNTIFAMRISELLGIVEIVLIPSIYYVIKERAIGSIIVVGIAAVYLVINIFYTVLVQVF